MQTLQHGTPTERAGSALKAGPSALPYKTPRTHPGDDPNDASYAAKRLRTSTEQPDNAETVAENISEKLCGGVASRVAAAACADLTCLELKKTSEPRSDGPGSDGPGLDVSRSDSVKSETSGDASELTRSYLSQSPDLKDSDTSILQTSDLHTSDLQTSDLQTCHLQTSDHETVQPTDKTVDDPWAVLTHVDGLALHLAPGTATGYRGVYISNANKGNGEVRTFGARVQRGGSCTRLGHFRTAVEAATCFAKYELELKRYKPKVKSGGGGMGQASDHKTAAPTADTPVTTHVDGLELHLAPGTATGYRGVYISTYNKESRTFGARVQRRGSCVRLGHFTTALEAATSYATYLDAELKRTKVKRGGAGMGARGGSVRPPFSTTVAVKTSVAERSLGLDLHLAPGSITGYKGVYIKSKGIYGARVARKSESVRLGSFSSPVTAAVAYARYVLALDEGNPLALPPQSVWGHACCVSLGLARPVVPAGGAVPSGGALPAGGAVSAGGAITGGGGLFVSAEGIVRVHLDVKPRLWFTDSAGEGGGAGANDGERCDSAEIDEDGRRAASYNMRKRDEASALALVPPPLAAGATKRQRRRTGRGREAPEEASVWAQCELCSKWRRLRGLTDEDALPELFYCALNPDRRRNSCAVKEEDLDSEEENAPAHVSTFMQLREWRKASVKIGDDRQAVLPPVHVPSIRAPTQMAPTAPLTSNWTQAGGSSPTRGNTLPEGGSTRPTGSGADVATLTQAPPLPASSLPASSPCSSPRCGCGEPAVWARERWWCARELSAGGCGFESRPPPLAMTPLCPCGSRALWHSGRWWCAHAQGGAGLCKFEMRPDPTEPNEGVHLSLWTPGEQALTVASAVTIPGHGPRSAAWASVCDAMGGRARRVARVGKRRHVERGGKCRRIVRGLGNPFDAEVARATAALLSVAARLGGGGGEIRGGLFEQLRPAGALPGLGAIVRPLTAALFEWDEVDARYEW